MCEQDTPNHNPTIKMIFYLFLGSLFALYALDLLALVIASWFARAQERRQAKVRIANMYPSGKTPDSCSCINHKSPAARLPVSTPASDGPLDAQKTDSAVIQAKQGHIKCPSSEGFSDSNSDGSKDDMTGPQAKNAELPFPFPRVAQANGPWLPEDTLLYPKVLIQLPQYNEEVYGPMILRKCCKITWPKERLLIQVLDDSTKHEVRAAVDNAALEAIEAGYPIQVIRRDNRGGFKAGALVEGLNQTMGSSTPPSLMLISPRPPTSCLKPSPISMATQS